jgi:predicted nuclease of predicted toxin-antitoxin system
MSKSNLKILVDENLDGMDERLKEKGYDAYSVRKLQIEGKKLGSDYSIINYARENNMIIVTKDTEFRKASEENNFPLILLDDEEIFNVIVEKLKKL